MTALETMTAVNVIPMPMAVSFFWETPKKMHSPRYLREHEVVDQHGSEQESEQHLGLAFLHENSTGS